MATNLESLPPQVFEFEREGRQGKPKTSFTNAQLKNNDDINVGVKGKHSGFYANSIRHGSNDHLVPSQLTPGEVRKTFGCATIDAQPEYTKPPYADPDEWTTPTDKENNLALNYMKNKSVDFRERGTVSPEFINNFEDMCRNTVADISKLPLCANSSVATVNKIKNALKASEWNKINILYEALKREGQIEVSFLYKTVADIISTTFGRESLSSILLEVCDSPVEAATRIGKLLLAHYVSLQRTPQIGESFANSKENVETPPFNFNFTGGDIQPRNGSCHKLEKLEIKNNETEHHKNFENYTPLNIFHEVTHPDKPNKLHNNNRASIEQWAFVQRKNAENIRKTNAFKNRVHKSSSEKNVTESNDLNLAELHQKAIAEGSTTDPILYHISSMQNQILNRLNSLDLEGLNDFVSNCNKSLNRNISTRGVAVQYSSTHITQEGAVYEIEEDEGDSYKFIENYAESSQVVYFETEAENEEERYSPNYKNGEETHDEYSDIDGNSLHSETGVMNKKYEQKFKENTSGDDEAAEEATVPPEGETSEGAKEKASRGENDEVSQSAIAKASEESNEESDADSSEEDTVSKDSDCMSENVPTEESNSESNINSSAAETSEDELTDVEEDKPTLTNSTSFSKKRTNALPLTIICGSVCLFTFLAWSNRSKDGSWSALFMNKVSTMMEKLTSFFPRIQQHTVS